jgi:hypothetical protein
MGTSVPAVRVIRGGGGAISAALLAVALVFSPGARAFAADLSATSGNGLNVTGAAASFLPQTAGGTGGAHPAETAAVTPPPAGPTAEQGWLSGLHVSGYLSQQFGMW